jgi:hypothetical protein
MLASLAMNGGSTKTHALLVGSPAIDAVASPCIAFDQRGEPRPEGNGCDIGAFEGETELIDPFQRIEVEIFIPEEEDAPLICPLTKMPFMHDAACLESSLSQEQLGQTLPMFVRGVSCLEPGVSMVSIDPGFKELGAQESPGDLLHIPTGHFETRVNDALQQCETADAYPGRLFCSGAAPPLNSIMQLSICWQGNDARFPCPPGFIRVQDSGSCMPLRALEDCQIECPDGYSFNPETGRCHVNMGDQVGSDGNALDAPACGEGYAWNALAGCCAPLNPEAGIYCPAETYYDALSGFCMPMMGDECPQGFRYEEESGLCQPESDWGAEICTLLEQSAPVCPQECPPGTVWSSEAGQCEVVLICRRDLNQADCEASGGTWRNPLTTAPFCDCP